MREHTAAQADDLYELISERAVNHRPLILTSNRPPIDWYPLFPNPVVAESLLDRLINTSHQVLMDGPVLPAPQTTRAEPRRRSSGNRRGTRAAGNPATPFAGGPRSMMLQRFPATSTVCAGRSTSARRVVLDHPRRAAPAGRPGGFGGVEHAGRTDTPGPHHPEPRTHSDQRA